MAQVRKKKGLITQDSVPSRIFAREKFLVTKYYLHACCLKRALLLPVCGCEMRPVVVHAKGLRTYACGFSHSGCVYVREVLSLWPCRGSTATHVTKF